MVTLVVRHVVPLKRKLVQRFWDIARWKKLSDAEHLLETVRMHTWGGQEILRGAVIASKGHINELKVSWFFNYRVFS